MNFKNPNLSIEHDFFQSFGKTILHRTITDAPVQVDATRCLQLTPTSAIDDSNRFSDATTTTIDDFD